MCVAGALNPKGMILILVSAAASTFGGTSGLLWATNWFKRGTLIPYGPTAEPLPIRGSWPLAVAAGAAAIAFIAILGPKDPFVALTRMSALAAVIGAFVRTHLPRLHRASADGGGAHEASLLVGRHASVRVSVPQATLPSPLECYTSKLAAKPSTLPCREGNTLPPESPSCPSRREEEFPGHSQPYWDVHKGTPLCPRMSVPKHPGIS